MVTGTVWITGSSGFLGGTFLRSWKQHYPNVSAVLLVRSAPATPNPDFTYAVAGDKAHGFTEAELQKLRVAKPPMAILHFATHFQNSYTPADAEKMVEANITFPTRMIEACRDLPELRFLNLGTFYSHASSSGGPITYYAATKASFEKCLDFYGTLPGRRAITLKLFDTYGAKDPRPKLIPKWIEILKTGEELKVTPGEQKLNLTHTDDIDCAIRVGLNLLFQSESASGSENGHWIYQVPAKENPAELPTLKEVAAEFERAAGKKLPLAFGALPYRANEIMSPRLDFAVLPGWKPTVNLQTGFWKIFSGT